MLRENPATFASISLHSEETEGYTWDKVFLHLRDEETETQGTLGLYIPKASLLRESGVSFELCPVLLCVHTTSVKWVAE